MPNGFLIGNGLASTLNSSSVDNSSAAMPVGNTYRGVGSDWFNANNVAREDWLRSEQSAENAFLRDMRQMAVANNFNSMEAQKQRDFEERMSNTSYQRAVADMKLAGLNPVLAFNNGGASTPSGSSASSSSVSRGSSGYRPRDQTDPLNNLVNTLAHIIGIYVSGKITGLNQSSFLRKKTDLDLGSYEIKKYIDKKVR